MNEERLEKLLDFLDKATDKSGVGVLIRSETVNAKHRKLTKEIVAYVEDKRNLLDVKVAFQDWLGALK